jgi:hypothetical protein
MPEAPDSKNPGKPDSDSESSLGCLITTVIASLLLVSLTITLACVTHPKGWHVSRIPVGHPIWRHRTLHPEPHPHQIPRRKPPW